jgi:hypothetical protein
MLRPPEHPKYVKVWTPRLRLYTEDEAVFLEEPLATVFAQFKGRTITRHHRTLQQELATTWRFESSCM